MRRGRRGLVGHALLARTTDDGESSEEGGDDSAQEVERVAEPGRMRVPGAPDDAAR
jgi:hypothetical protein